MGLRRRGRWGTSPSLDNAGLPCTGIKPCTVAPHLERVFATWALSSRAVTNDELTSG